MIETIKAPKLISLKAPLLVGLTKEKLKEYFKNTWDLYEMLFSSIQSESTFLLSPDPLRNPLIFYWGHTAAFYINKLHMAGLLKKGIHPRFEQLFAVGVDPDLPENLSSPNNWPDLQEVNDYRKKVFARVFEVIDCFDCDEPITEASPWWALMMGLEHDRIHFETSSVLIRQLPVHLVKRPKKWSYAPTYGKPSENVFIKVKEGSVKIGKPKDSTTYGWDNEFGYLDQHVPAFKATKNLISNAEYLDFVESGAYNFQSFWTDEGWDWKNQVNSTHLKFWVEKEGRFLYRAMFDEIPMPMDWPVEVNAHEALAYCRWRGKSFRLLSEAEFNLIATKQLRIDPALSNHYNLHMAFGSPCPVGMVTEGQNVDGFNDLYGNVWDWLSDDFYPLPGFKVNPLYEEFSAPFFDSDHSMLLGGAWSTVGAGTSRYYRLWFRRHFYQHAGFRLAQDL